MKAVLHNFVARPELILLALLIFIFVRGINGQEEKEKLRLENATILEGDVVNGVKVRYLTGNVEFRQGQSRMYCERATEFVDQGYVLFTGNVSIFSDSRSLFADKVSYYENSRVSIAEGNVKLVDSLRILTSARARYNEIENTVTAFENVVIKDDENRLKLSGNRAEYRRNDGYALVEQEPVVIRFDSTGAEEIRITADKVELFDDGERMVAAGNVHITREKLQAQCGEAEYVRADNLIRLKKQPIARQKFNNLFGSEISLMIQDKKINHVKIAGHATITSKVDTLSEPDHRMDLLLGEEIFIALKENEIDSVHVAGRATSYYHVIEDSLYRGLNKSLGDAIIMKFNKGELARVQISSSPGSTNGTYLPPGQDGLLEQEIQSELERRQKALTGTQSDARSAQ